MNISFFLKPKIEVSYLLDDCPVRQALDDMLKSGFTAIPVISPKGKYVGTITEGDFLRLLLHHSPELCEQLLFRLHLKHLPMQLLYDQYLSELQILGNMFHILSLLISLL